MEEDYIIKCRTLFIYSLSLLYGGYLGFDDELNFILYNFLLEHFYDYFDMFELIFHFEKEENGDIYLCEKDEWFDKTNNYLKYFNNKNYRMISNLYNEIGTGNVTKISELATLFCDYVNNYNNNLIRIKN